MKGTMYRPSPKISPLYEQSMGGHRSPVPFNREIPTPLRPLFVPERNRRSRLLARSSLRSGVGMTQYRNGPLSHGVRHDSSDIAQKGEPRGLRPAKFQFIYLILLKRCIFKAFRLPCVPTLCIFPCFCPYELKQGKVFYSPPTTLSSSLAEVRFASLVA